MRHGLTGAQRELLPTLEHLTPTTRFQLIAYNQKVEYLLADAAALQPVDAASVRQARQALLTLQAMGGTHHTVGLARGLALQPEVLVLFTDADEMTPQEIREITYLNNGRTAIHVVVFHWREEAPTNTPLQQLASLNRGSYRLVVPQP